MKVIKNYLYNTFYQIFILIVPLITTPYLARVLGPKGVGINSYTNSIIQYFILFGSIGVNLYGNRQVAFIRDNRTELTHTFYEIFLMRLVTIIFAYFCFVIFFFFLREYQIYYLAQSISIIAMAFDISWFFMGVEDFAITIFRNLIVKVLTLISIFIFVKSYDDLTTYILILSLSLLFGNITLFPSLQRYIGKAKLSELKIWRHLWPSLILFIPQIATQIYLVLNKTMLGLMVSVQASGYFDQSDKLVKVILAVATATGTVMLPHVANAFAKGKSEKTKKLLYESFSFVSAISIPMMFGLMAISSKFVPLFFTSKFTSVIPIMMIESVVIILIAWSNAIGTQFLLPTKQTKSYTLSVILGAIVNFIANVPLIIMFGAVGAAIATVLSELAVTIYQLIALRGQVVYKKLFRDFWKYFFAGIVMLFLVSYLNGALGKDWISLILEVLLGIFVYIIILILLRARILKKIGIIFKS